MGLQWFFRVLAQWSVIASISCLPLFFPGAGMVLWVFCCILLFGLLCYGLANPALLIPRTLAWGAATTISASLASTLRLSLTPESLVAIGLSQQLANAVATLLELLNRPILVWPAIAVLALLAAYDRVLPLVDRVLKTKTPNGLLARRGEHVGRLTLPARGAPFEALHWFSVHNCGTVPLPVTGASLTLGWGVTRRARLFHGPSPAAEVTETAPLRLDPGETVPVMLAATGFPTTFDRIFVSIAAVRLAWLLEIDGTAQFYGDAVSEGLPVRTSFVIRRRVDRLARPRG